MQAFCTSSTIIKKSNFMSQNRAIYDIMYVVIFGKVRDSAYDKNQTL